jgi:protein-disulfide isomerase
MSQIINIILALTFSVLLISSPLNAQEVNEDLIKNLVQQEIDRLINTEGALDLAVEKGIQNYILKQRAAAEQKKANQQQALASNLRSVDPERDHIFGNPDAPITLIEYSDFECPFCKRFHPEVEQLLENNADNVRWVYRHFPLEFHNPGAQKQAEASECVARLNGNDAFWTFAELLYKRTKSNGKGFPLQNLTPLAEEIGVDGVAFSECLDSGEMATRVKEDHENGIKVGISGTPGGFLVNQDGNTRLVAGALPLDNLQALVDELSK